MTFTNLEHGNVYDLSIEDIKKGIVDLDIIDEISNVSCVYVQYTGDLSKMYIGESNRYFLKGNKAKGRYWEHINESKYISGNIPYNGFERVLIVTSKFLKGNANILETLLLKYMDVEFLMIKNRQLTNSRLQQKHAENLSADIENILFPEIWTYLLKNRFVKNQLEEVVKSVLSYYSPYGKKMDEIELESVNKIIELGMGESEKPNLLINGEPGTGKTFITTLSVMELIKQGKKIAIIVNQTTIKKLYNLFFYTFKMSEQPFVGSLANFHNGIKHNKFNVNEFSAIIVDEAHRLKHVKGKQQRLPSVFVLDDSNPEYTELDILMNYKVPVILMYDKFQLIRDSDIYIDKFKEKTNGLFDSMTLETQYRIKSSSDVSASNYTKGIRSILQLEDVKYDTSIFTEGYDFQIVDSLEELIGAIRRKLNVGDKNKNSRLLSGYYKKWISKEEGLVEWREEVYNVSLKWNTPNDKLGKKNWLQFTQDKSLELKEIGCVHVVQGLDLDYAGVIIGRDIKLIETNGERLLVADSKNYFDANGTPVKDTDIGNKRLDEYIKKIYYILLTRGIYGTYVYFEDKEIEQYFRDSMDL